MAKMTDLQRAQVEEILDRLFTGEPTRLIVSHLVDVAEPHTLDTLLIERGTDLLNEGDDNEFAQKVIDVGASLKRIL